MNILGRKFHPVTCVAVAILTAAALAGCGDDDQSSDAANASAPPSAAASTQPASTAPAVRASNPAPSTPAANPTTAPTFVVLVPEEGVINSVDRTAAGKVTCQEDWVPVVLRIGGTKSYYGVRIETHRDGDLGITISIDNGPSALTALIVNGEAATPITPELREAPRSTFRLDTADWGPFNEEITACASGQ